MTVPLPLLVGGVWAGGMAMRVLRGREAVLDDDLSSGS